MQMLDVGLDKHVLIQGLVVQGFFVAFSGVFMKMVRVVMVQVKSVRGAAKVPIPVKAHQLKVLMDARLV
jgi:hypothetical protein